MPAERLPPAAVPDEADFEARVLRAFIRDGRLVAIPARERKKRVVLRHLLDRVLPDAGEIGEPELNLRLALWHPDASALRRYLVDAGLVARDAMRYRRVFPVPVRAMDGAEPEPGGADGAEPEPGGADGADRP
jgi:hypothetical protein